MLRLRSLHYSQHEQYQMRRRKMKVEWMMIRNQNGDQKEKAIEIAKFPLGQRRVLCQKRSENKGRPRGLLCAKPAGSLLMQRRPQVE
jgi:hypothetical protein